MKLALLAGAVAWAAAGGAWAGEGGHPARPVSAGFERLKALVGAWEGTSEMEGKPEKVRVEYRLTSGGTALVETLGPGTPHEMVSVYHDEAGLLVMTHYCALGNQPRLRLASLGAHELRFELAPGASFDPKLEHHMNALTLLLPAPGLLEQRWVSRKDGKDEAPTVFKLSRVVPASPTPAPEAK